MNTEAFALLSYIKHQNVTQENPDLCDTKYIKKNKEILIYIQKYIKIYKNICSFHFNRKLKK